MEKQTNKNGVIVAIISMMFLFAMISFVTNLAAPFGNIWGKTYSWAGMVGNLMNFLAYLFMGIPAGKMLVKYGYKKTALIAMAVGFIGLFIQYLSSIFGGSSEMFTIQENPVMLNFIIYLIGAFICGFCVCMLNTVVNPMLNLLGGGGNRGNQLIQTGGTLNSLTATLTPFFVGVLIGEVTDKTSMNDVTPLLWVAMAVFAVTFLIIAFVTIPEPQSTASGVTFEHSPWNFRHFVLGVIAIFFYVGIEVGVPAELNFYITKLGFPGAAAIAGGIVAIYWLLMLVGRFISSFVSGKISSRAQLISTSTLGIILLVIAILLPESSSITFHGVNVPVKCFFIIACGICTSIMWGCIFNLATEGLGKYTAPASGIFMTMVVGGGVMPFIQDQIATSLNDYISSYWLIVAMLGYLLYYGLVGSKNVNKDIPVD
ncbi:MFS transporter [Hoylesella timonensis]|uniref:MFS transporter n=1 Tax=Hoylesella timonensis TaxID=386414 RepID=UPI00242CE0AF|nr:MFS transporter [Hoylesella timonensis]